MNNEEKELYHYGIPGMKWGVRNEDNKSNNKNKQKEDDEIKRSKNNKRKKIIKIGAITVGSAAAIYGGYLLYKNPKVQDLCLKGKQMLERKLNKNKGSGDILLNLDEISKNTGFKFNESQISIKDSTIKVNPGYKSGDPKFKNNCFSAVTADIINRLNDGKGLNVVARGATDNELRNHGMTFNNLLKVFKDSSINDIIIPKSKVSSTKEVKSFLNNKINDITKGENGLGIIRIKSYDDSSIGHYIKWEIKDSVVSFSDSLTGSTNCDAYFDKISRGMISRGLEFSRVDGLEIDPEELMKIVSRN